MWPREVRSPGSAGQQRGAALRADVAHVAGYMASGKDGYASLVGAKMLVDEENGALLSCIIREAFAAARVIQVARALERARLDLRGRLHDCAGAALPGCRVGLGGGTR